MYTNSLYINFYYKIEEYLKDLSNFYNISNEELEKYFSCSDYHNDNLKNYKEIKFVFAQMVFHAQNATLISKIVSFEENISFLDSITFGFDPLKFSNKYPVDNYDTSLNRLVNDLRYNKNTNPNGLHWNTTKSANKDTIIKRFAGSLLYISSFLSRYRTKEDVLEYLKKYYPEKNYKNYICLKEKFIKIIPVGFGTALACDFLKEFDSYFDLPKPDIHIKDALRALLGKEIKNDDEAVKYMFEIVECVNKEKDLNLSIYKFDRMIWLCCTSNFFLHNKFSKNNYIKRISYR